MKIKNILLVAAGLCITLGAYAQKKKTFYVPKAGTLVELLTEDEANRITHLTLQGKINAIDFRHLRDEFLNLKVLDISNATISMYTGKNGTFPDKFYVYPGNCIPAYAFCKQNADGSYQGKQSLERVILSDKTKNIEDAAFKGCTNLKICQVRKKTAPNLLPQALADSITAVFVPLGSTDSYRGKERWEKFSFVEGDPTEAIIEIGPMSSLESELMRSGIQPHSVNFLTIKGKMDEADFKLLRNYMPNLVSVNLEECTCTVIPEYTFTQKKYMLNITLPKGLTTIGQRAFSGCTRLTGTLVLPASVTAIEYGAFIGCDNLRRVLATSSKITTLGDNLFGENNTNKIVYQSAQ